MNKHDWTLLLVRGFGLYILAQALFSVPPLLGWVYTLCVAWDSMFAKDDLGGMAGRLRSEFATQVISAVARVVLYGCAGLYLVRSTSILRRLGIPEAISD